METSKRKRIGAGILGLLLGTIFMALMIPLLMGDLRSPNNRAHGLWVLAALPAVPLLVGAIGTILGSRILAWVLFITNSIFLIWVLLVCHGHIFAMLTFTRAHPEGFPVVIALLLESLAGMHLFEAREHRIKLMTGFLFGMLALGYGLRRFAPNWPASQIQPAIQGKQGL